MLSGRRGSMLSAHSLTYRHVGNPRMSARSPKAVTKVGEPLPDLHWCDGRRLDPQSQSRVLRALALLPASFEGCTLTELKSELTQIPIQVG